MNRQQYEYEKQRRIDLLEAEAEYHTNEAEKLYHRIAELEACSYEEALRDAAFDEAKNRKVDL